MSNHPTSLERAFALAQSGDCLTVSQIRKRLTAEGYSHTAIEGPSLLRQLREICAKAQAAGA
ncbi:MAG: hypothetical protein EOP02_21050 [Proteobacteria bacterium]|nr:MAG: hypothetical protein EOP02_21050 [Pseudomonadota bacterium]